MEPAFEIPLDESQLAQLGELTAIIGQVDEILTRTVERLLQVDRAAANYVMGSSKVADNAGIWCEVIRNRSDDEDILWLVKHAMNEMRDVSAGRNDYIHAWFEFARNRGHFGGRHFAAGTWAGGFFGPPAILKARRIKSDKTRLFFEIAEVRNRAARLSCLVAHIDFLLANEPSAVSPWLERLGPTLPPRPPPDETQRRGTEQRGQRKSSAKTR